LSVAFFQSSLVSRVFLSSKVCVFFSVQCVVLADFLTSSSFLVSQYRGFIFYFARFRFSPLFCLITNRRVILLIRFQLATLAPLCLGLFPAGLPLIHLLVLLKRFDKNPLSQLLSSSTQGYLNGRGQSSGFRGPSDCRENYGEARNSLCLLLIKMAWSASLPILQKNKEL